MRGIFVNVSDSLIDDEVQISLKIIVRLEEIEIMSFVGWEILLKVILNNNKKVITVDA